jgi:hypothetical protein
VDEPPLRDSCRLQRKGCDYLVVCRLTSITNRPVI